jgi:hypothetical protein
MVNVSCRFLFFQDFESYEAAATILTTKTIANMPVTEDE